mmetsp:Transcript_18660/g.37718  ORF Transcript_18660/g.37718 Transcript_18660/m.37718 type:complete len:320 (+) Transcript_18660:774-1733(+)
MPSKACCLIVSACWSWSLRASSLMSAFSRSIALGLLWTLSSSMSPRFLRLGFTPPSIFRSAIVTAGTEGLLSIALATTTDALLESIIESPRVATSDPAGTPSVSRSSSSSSSPSTSSHAFCLMICVACSRRATAPLDCTSGRLISDCRLCICWAKGAGSASKPFLTPMVYHAMSLDELVTCCECLTIAARMKPFRSPGFGFTNSSTFALSVFASASALASRSLRPSEIFCSAAILASFSSICFVISSRSLATSEFARSSTLFLSSSAICFSWRTFASTFSSSASLRAISARRSASSSALRFSSSFRALSSIFLRIISWA